MKIAVDIDGVLIDVIPAFNRAAALRCLRADWTRYDGGFELIQWRLIHDCAFTSFVANCQPYPETVEVLTRWAKHHDILYLTARRSLQESPYIDDYIERMTVKQMRKWFPAGEIIFAQDKVKVVREREIEMMVEDFLTNAIKLNYLVHTFLIDRPWNRDEFYPLRVYSLKDIPMGGW